MTYLALTIGPIVETLMESKKTKELFAGSYLFSYFMKNLLIRFHEMQYSLILPYHKEIKSLFDSQNGVGMFHDRLIVSSEKTKEDIQDDVNTFVKDSIDLIVNGVINIDPQKNSKQKTEIEEFFKNYFQISYLITDKFSLKEITNKLDVCELHREFIIFPDKYKQLRDQEGEKVNPLIYLQRKFHQSFLKDDAFGEKKSDFPSVLEIALGKTIDYTYNDKEDDKREEEALKGEKTHKKYMALIQGDGDRIGAILKKIDTDPEQIKLFSQKLLDFAKEIPSVASKYKAQVVYAGGDDMLAFAPIIAPEQKTVFDFLKELDNKFKEIIKELNIYEAENVSQSFGVTIFYYKKPLYQALQKALYNLFSIAKQSNEMNKAVVELIKHSGQTFTVDIILNSTSYELFSNLLEIELDAEQSALPHSITHNLQRSKNLLKAIANNYKDAKLSEKIENFFENNFNKEIHDDTMTQQTLTLTRNLLTEELKLYQKNLTATPSTEKREELFDTHFTHFSALLSTIKHLRGDR